MPIMQYLELVPLDDTSFASDDPGRYACRLSPRGNLGMDSVHETEVLISSLIRGGLTRLIFNMENLSYIDSVGIGMIIKMRKMLAATGGDFALYNVPPKVNDVFELVNLKDYIRTFYSEAQAIEYLRRSEISRNRA